jgi:hypothetical protein
LLDWFESSDKIYTTQYMERAIRATW